MKLHLVDQVDGRVMRQALCGYAVNEWCMTTNVTLGNVCRNCVRVSRAKNPSPRTYVVL